MLNKWGCHINLVHVVMASDIKPLTWRKYDSFTDMDKTLMIKLKIKLLQ